MWARYIAGKGTNSGILELEKNPLSPNTLPVFFFSWIHIQESPMLAEYPDSGKKSGENNQVYSGILNNSNSLLMFK